MARILAIFPEALPMWRHAEELLSAAIAPDALAVAHDIDTGGGQIADAEIILTFALTPAAAGEARRLRWVQSLGSGVDAIALGTGAARPVLTNMQGLHGPAVSEAAIALMLAHGRRLPAMAMQQAAREWRPAISQLLHGQTLGILGTGVIAAALAAKARVFGMRVIAFSAAPRESDAFDAVLPRADLTEQAGALDHLVLLAPLDATTHHIIEAALLARMKPGAMLVNVGRGGLVDQAALIAALQTGRIAAALDVFETEPLPADNPLWTLPNVIITPHSAGRHAGYVDDAIGLFLRNLARFEAGDVTGMVNRLG